MKYWKIKFWGIRWDDGKGDYDVSALPQDVEVEVNEDTQVDAIELALSRVSDHYGFLIDDVKVTEVDSRALQAGAVRRNDRRDDLD